jgi:hypothetical protein
MLLDLQLQLYSTLVLHFRIMRPNHGCILQPKHVAIYNYYNKELGTDRFKFIVAYYTDTTRMTYIKVEHRMFTKSVLNTIGTILQWSQYLSY